MTFASTSVPRHLLRGAIGLGSVIGAVALIPTVGVISLLLLPVALIAFRGCPTCWVVGLFETISRGKLRRDCADGACRLTTAG